MKGIPPIGWLMAVFLFLSAGTLVYGRSGPEALPDPVSAWEVTELLRGEIQDRTLSLTQGQSVELRRAPYVIGIERLNDLELPERTARYVLRIRSAPEVAALNRWFGHGVDVALIDASPGELYGAVRPVTLRQAKPQAETFY